MILKKFHKFLKRRATTVFKSGKFKSLEDKQKFDFTKLFIKIKHVKLEVNSQDGEGCILLKVRRGLVSMRSHFPLKSTKQNRSVLIKLMPKTFAKELKDGRTDSCCEKAVKKAKLGLY